MKKLFLLLLLLIGGCIHHASIQFDIPKRPELPVAHFDKCTGNMYCTNTDGLRAIYRRDAIRDTYEEQLINTIEGCNQILK